MSTDKKRPVAKKRTRDEANAMLEEAADQAPSLGKVPVSSSEPEAKRPEPKPVEPGPAPVVAPEPKPVEARVALRVYLAACKHRWDQMAGFKVDAKALVPGSRTMREWEEAYQTYLKRPVI